MLWLVLLCCPLWESVADSSSYIMTLHSVSLVYSRMGIILLPFLFSQDFISESEC